jgi:hypothetical protein
MLDTPRTVGRRSCSCTGRLTNLPCGSKSLIKRPKYNIAAAREDASLQGSADIDPASNQLQHVEVPASMQKQACQKQLISM